MSVINAARNLAEDFPGGASELARAIDKNPTTLNHELLGIGTAKLGLLTAVKMSRRAQDRRILNAFAGEMGCWVLQLPEYLSINGNEAMQDLGRISKEFADVVQEVTTACADGQITGNELSRVEREWGELLAAGQLMIAHLRARHEAAKPQQPPRD